MNYFQKCQCIFYLFRYLHGKDPNEWTVDRLTESFPVDARGVHAILKARSLANPNQIRKQDLQVRENFLGYFIS